MKYDVINSDFSLAGFCSSALTPVSLYLLRPCSRAKPTLPARMQVLRIRMEQES